MAKKKTRAAQKAVVKTSSKDQETLKKMNERLAKVVVRAARTKVLPSIPIPSRSLSNVHYNERKKYIEMGDTKVSRELFNLGQAKSFMQTLLVGKGCKQLIEEGKTASIRQVFYLLKGNIDGTSENTFEVQEECDPIIEDVEVTLEALREELHVFASNRGAMVGNIVLNDSGDEIDCSRMGSGGYSIPSIVEPDIMTFKKVDAEFILHVEKDTVWRRFNEDKFWKKHNCILTHGGGQPPRGVRRLLYRLHNEHNLPVYCLLDNDPWGYYIYSVIKQGSINLAYESKRMAIPKARYLGLRSIDFGRCGLSTSVTIQLTDQDRKRAQQIRQYPWFQGEAKKKWQAEIEQLVKNGFKLEVEALISKSISYVTEEYVPQRLKDKDYLD